MNSARAGRLIRTLPLMLWALSPACADPTDPGPDTSTPIADVHAPDSGPASADTSAAVTCGPCEVPEGEGCASVGVGTCPYGFQDDGRCGCAPVLEACADHQVPQLGGGCAATGPACDLASTSETDAGHCEPVTTQCGAGEAPAEGGGCKGVGAPVDCPTGPFPEAPAGATGVLHVAAGTSAEVADGSAALPYPTVALALAHAEPGAAVLIAEGQYDEAVHIHQPVQLVGLCPAKVSITGSGLTGVELPPGTVARATIEVMGVAGSGPSGGAVRLSGLRVAGPDIGVLVFMVDDVVLSDVRVDGGAGAAVFVALTGSAALEWVTLSGASPLPSGDLGDVLTLSSSKGSLERSLIEGGEGNGVAVFESTLAVSDTVIRNVGLGDGGAGLRVADSSLLTAHRTVVTGAHGRGVHVTESVATFLDSLVTKTVPGNTTVAFGALVDGPASLVMTRTAITDTEGMALQVKEGTVKLTESVLGPCHAGGDFALPLHAIDSKVRVEDSVIAGGVGAGALINGGTVDVARVVFRDISPTVDKPTQLALVAFGGADVSVDATLMTGAASAVVIDEGAEARVSGSQLVGGLGPAAYVGKEGLLTLSKSRLLGWRYGVLAVGGRAEVTGTLIDLGTTSPTPGDEAVTALEGATVEVTGCALLGPWSPAIFATASELSVTDSAVLTGPSAELPDDCRGLFAAHGTTVTVEGSVFAGHRVAAVDVYEGCELSVVRSVVRDVAASPDERWGTGIHAAASRVTLTDTIVDGAHRAGVLMLGPTAEGTLERCRVTGVEEAKGHAGDDGEAAPADGVAAQWGAKLALTSSLLSNNVRAGAIADGRSYPKTEDLPTALTLLGCTISGNLLGAAVQNSASFDGSGNQFTSNDVDDVMQDGGIWLDSGELPPLGPPPVSAPGGGP